MPVHPVANIEFLDGSNYRTWGSDMDMLLDSKDLLLVIEIVESYDRHQKAQVRNILSEHCVPEIRKVRISLTLILGTVGVMIR